MMLNKVCSCCKIEKPCKDFHKKGDGYQPKCKSCRKQDSKSYYKDNKESILKKNKIWVENNKNTEQYKAVRKAIAARSWQKNKDNFDHAKHYEKNSTYYKSKGRSRKSRLLQATPIWLSVEQKQEIDTIYLKAIYMSDMTECAYHVDHIIPLKGASVCGLHVPWNLQIIPAKDNLKKSNTYNDW